MGEIYKKYLKQVNLYINNKFFINPYIHCQIKYYIIVDFRLSEVEKKYLINKIERFRYEYLKGLSKGTFDIFKLPKRNICFENIYFLICLIDNTNLNNERIKKKISINLDRTFIEEERKNTLRSLLNNNAR